MKLIVDSTGKSIDGALSGTLTSLGEFDQCIETVVPDPKKKDDVLFEGQYCLVEIRFRVPPKKKRYNFYDRVTELENFTGTEVLKFFTENAHLSYYYPIRLGVCIPSGCTDHDLNQIVALGAEQLHVDAETTHCETKHKERPLLGIQIFAM
ncbi:UNVERIFIED_CONTAM: hypothetical protein NCL1_31616 [Trichonephila clavipes]